MRIHVLSYTCVAMAFAMVISSCQIKQLSIAEMTAHSRALRMAQYSEFDHFVYKEAYPKTMAVFVDYKLMRKADKSSSLYICLNQHRARFYVGGQVAMDFPVSTGTSKRATGIGSFLILEKKEKHASNIYGRMYDVDNKLVLRNADFRKDIVPEGGRFVGANMPYWQRFTWAGIGMHVGRVKAGQRLSHGCIRATRRAASLLYKATFVNKTRVHIIKDIEVDFPSLAVINQKRTDLAYEKVKKEAADAKKKKS